VAFFRKAVSLGRLSPFGEKAQKEIAEIFFSDLKQYRKAIPEYQLLIDKFPASRLNAEAQYRIGECYMELADYAQARIEFAVVLDRYSDSTLRSAAAYGVALSYLREGDLREARRRLENFVAFYAESPQVLNARLSLADALEGLGEIDEALQVLTALERDYPNREVILRKVDSLLKKKGDKAS